MLTGSESAINLDQGLEGFILLLKSMLLLIQMVWTGKKRLTLKLTYIASILFHCKRWMLMGMLSGKQNSKTCLF